MKIIVFFLSKYMGKPKKIVYLRKVVAQGKATHPQSLTAKKSPKGVYSRSPPCEQTVVAFTLFPFTQTLKALRSEPASTIKNYETLFTFSYHSFWS